MAYIRDGLVVVAKNNKPGRKGYGDIGKYLFMCGEGIQFVNLGKLVIPKKYWYKKFRLKIELIDKKVKNNGKSS